MRYLGYLEDKCDVCTQSVEVAVGPAGGNQLSSIGSNRNGR